jgi:hypothetical protein
VVLQARSRLDSSGLPGATTCCTKSVLVLYRSVQGCNNCGFTGADMSRRLKLGGCVFRLPDHVMVLFQARDLKFHPRSAGKNVSALRH